MFDENYPHEGETGEQEPPPEDAGLVPLKVPLEDYRLSQLAALPPGQGQAYIKNLDEIGKGLRRSAIMQTHPTDWTLFQRGGEQGAMITGYLGDDGCQRVAYLWGIQVKITGVDRIDVGDDYLITVTGDAFSLKLGMAMHQIEGARSSDEDFLKTVSSPLKRLANVRKAARANLMGQCVRKIGGLNNVPIEELILCWQGTSKDVKQCNKGRGFGLGAFERYGQDESPKCPKCNSVMKLKEPRAGSKFKDPFWGCTKYPQCNGVVKDSDWKRQRAAIASQDPPEDDGAPPASPSEQPGPEPVDLQELGKHKAKLLERVKGKPFEKKVKSMILGAKNEAELMDLETVIKDELAAP